MGDDEIDNEEEEEDEDNVDYYSQQPFEVYDAVMDPLRVELNEYLERDEKYDWIYTNEHVKKQHRSISLDLVVPYEMGEDEYIASRATMEARQKADTMQSNPYL